MTDPISQMIITMKNASRAEHKTVTLPYSKLKHAIADCLVKQGYLKDVSKKTENNKSVLVLDIAYEDNRPKLNDIKRISTPKGILTDKEARKEMVGGEALFKLW
jgi:small subunit ribosomal protein S8